MAQALPHPFSSFRFYLDAGPGTARRFAISLARDTAHGLELGRPHIPGFKTLYEELVEAELHQVTIVMQHRDPGVRREVTYALGKARRHLAVDLDSMKNDMAVDRVLFPDAVLLRCRDVNETVVAGSHEE